MDSSSSSAQSPATPVSSPFALKFSTLSFASPPSPSQSTLDGHIPLHLQQTSPSPLSQEQQHGFLSDPDFCPFADFPEELLMQIFEYLNWKDLVTTSLVSTIWNRVSNTPRLWYRLSLVTGRIINDQTEQLARVFCRTRAWKEFYFWITSSDMKVRQPDDFKEFIRDVECEPLKKSYLHLRSIADQPENSLYYQLYADFLIDQPDVEGSWDLAESLYQKACELVRKHNTVGVSRYHAAFILFRYAYFLARNRRNNKEANNHYLELFRLLPPNAWTVERYAVFLSEHSHQHGTANAIFSHLAVLSQTSSSLSSYAFFKWHIQGQHREANDLFKRACIIDKEKIYFYANFIARQNDKEQARIMLQGCPLLKHIQSDPTDAESVFAMALAYHQVPMTEEAECLYRQHLKLTPKPNIYALSNLAELLLHSCGRLDEAQELYEQALVRAGGHNETVEVALVGLRLVRGDRAEGLRLLQGLLESSYIQASKNTFTEAAIIRYIHCFPEQKREALTLVKKMLVTEETRPKLILMFDANLNWAKANNTPDFELMKGLAAVYNCEMPIDHLNQFREWEDILVDPPTPSLD